jgi:hypothetical protein
MAGEPENGQVPEPGEAIHLPDPTYLPIIVAAGVTVAIVGVVVHPFLLVAGVLITVVATTRWVRGTRRDISELPLEHGH